MKDLENLFDRRCQGSNQTVATRKNW